MPGTELKRTGWFRGFLASEANPQRSKLRRITNLPPQIAVDKPARPASLARMGRKSHRHQPLPRRRNLVRAFRRLRAAALALVFVLWLHPAGITLLGIAMWLGRFLMIVPVLAIAGSLAAKKKVPVGEGTLPTHGPLFVALLIGTVLLVGLLNYVPALALGPVVEHLMLWN